MKMKLFTILISLSIVSTCLVGCGRSSATSASTSGKANLTVLVYAQDHEKTVYEQMIEEFKEVHKDEVDNVTFEVTTKDDYETKMTAAMTANDMPDIFYIGPDTVRSYVDNGYVMALDDMIANNDKIDTSDIWPEIINAYQYDGETVGTGSLYALPKDLSTFAYAYNKDLFDEAGLEYPDPENPYTWDEFVDVCKALTKDTDGDGEVDQWGCGLANAYCFTPFVYGNNATFLNDDFTKVVIDGQDAFLDAFQYYADLTLKYKVTPTVEQDSALGFYQRWLDGQLGFYACGTWDVAAFLDDETFPYEWDLCGWPVGDSQKSTTWNSSVGFAVSSSCENPELALDLISYLSVDEEGQKELCGETSGKALQIPNIMEYAKTTFKEKVNTGEIPYASNIDVIFNYIEGTDNYQGLFTETTYTYNAEWFDIFVEGMPNVMNGSMTPQEYITEVQPKMQDALDNAIELQNSETK